MFADADWGVANCPIAEQLLNASSRRTCSFELGTEGAMFAAKRRYFGQKWPALEMLPLLKAC